MLTAALLKKWTFLGVSIVFIFNIMSLTQKLPKMAYEKSLLTLKATYMGKVRKLEKGQHFQTVQSPYIFLLEDTF